MPHSLLTTTPKGLYCPAGDFYVDPHGFVDRAVISHGHSDHARRVAKKFLAHTDSEAILRARLGSDISLQTAGYGETVTINGVKVTLFPAGHLLGSSQIRIEHGGSVTVFTGDFGTTPNPTCEPYEPVKCDTFITESTFGLPIYDWDDPATVHASINSWWKRNRDRGMTSLLYAYSLGKAQRIIAGLDTTIGPVFVHGSVDQMNKCYEIAGVKLPETKYLEKGVEKLDELGAMVIAPQSATAEAWLNRLGEFTTGFASGWMMVRGRRRMGNIAAGFVLSDHADWNGLLKAVEETGAEKILATHGFSEQFTRYLRGRGFDAEPLETAFLGDGGFNSQEVE